MIATGQGVFELTGFREQDVLGQDVMKVFGMNGDDRTLRTSPWSGVCDSSTSVPP